jgi:hypothetical protein
MPTPIDAVLRAQARKIRVRWLSGRVVSRSRQIRDGVSEAADLLVGAVQFGFDLLEHGEVADDFLGEGVDGVGEVLDGWEEAWLCVGSDVGAIGEGAAVEVTGVVILRA